mmetsp:Transcript_32986/g.32141  ORF Transcript_32986/g.32141 Transcript_32986/m.32141 type:complete len:84 (-) Transcript_32986:28-279(-)
MVNVNLLEGFFEVLFSCLNPLFFKISNDHSFKLIPIKNPIAILVKHFEVGLQTGEVGCPRILILGVWQERLHLVIRLSQGIVV